MSDTKPDWENFSKAVLADWPTGDLEGSVLFDLSLQYGMIKEVPGGYNSDHHFDNDGICPEEGDPWYEYTFGGEAGPGLYSIAEMKNTIAALTAQVAELVEAATALHHAICSDTGFVAAVRADSGLAYPWPALDAAEERLTTALAKIKEQTK